MNEYGYDDILKMKQECFNNVYSTLGSDHLKIFKYHKGDILPFINKKVRKNMTCGDIDGFQWDFYKKKLRIIESKRTNENSKQSQDTFLKFLAENIKIDGYDVEVYKIIADPPFNESRVIDIKNDKEIIMNEDELIKFLNME